MGASGLGCGHLALKLELTGDKIDKMRQRTGEPLTVPYTNRPTVDICGMRTGVTVIVPYSEIAVKTEEDWEYPTGAW